MKRKSKELVALLIEIEFHLHSYFLENMHVLFSSLLLIIVQNSLSDKADRIDKIMKTKCS